MHHPIDNHTEVQALVPSCKTCGGIKRYNTIRSRIISSEFSNGKYTYTLATGDLVPQHNIQQVT